MATEKHRDEYGVILHHEDQGLLELRWLETSADMTGDDFMRSMERYAALVLRGTPARPRLVKRVAHDASAGLRR